MWSSIALIYLLVGAILSMTSGKIYNDHTGKTFPMVSYIISTVFWPIMFGLGIWIMTRMKRK